LGAADVFSGYSADSRVLEVISERRDFGGPQLDVVGPEG
jgi:hypothetical protein